MWHHLFLRIMIGFEVDYFEGRADANKARPSQPFQPSRWGWQCLFCTGPSNSKILGALNHNLLLILLFNLRNRQCEQGHYLMHNAHAWTRKRIELEVQYQKVNGQLTPPRPSEISEKNVSTQAKPFLTSHSTLLFQNILT